MENPVQDILKQQGFLVLDGALATELEARGADLNHPLWSAKMLIEAPELIYAVHLDYLKAGADMITTSTYQATFEGLSKRGLSRQEVIALFRKSIALAMRARAEFWSVESNRKNRIRPIVVASVGPYGAFLADGSEYRGNYGLTVQEIMDFHRPRMEILAQSETAIFAFETIPCIEEAEALLTLLKDFPQIKALLSFSCKVGRRLSSGEFFSDGIKLANTSEQIIAVGVNCTSPQFILPLLQSVKGITKKPLLIYPNSGELWDAHRHCWLPGNEEKQWLEWVEAWYRAGARIIGGCCRTRPEDIYHLRQQLLNISFPTI